MSILDNFVDVRFFVNISPGLRLGFIIVNYNQSRFDD